MTEKTARPARKLSPVQAHLQRMAAQKTTQAEASVGDVSTAVTHEHQLLMAQLYEHRKHLKSIQSVERKIEAKADMVEAYDAYLDGVISGPAPTENDPILSTMMVWNIDVGRFDRALQLAEYVLRHGVSLPDQYQRDPATLLIDEFSTAALGGKMPNGDEPNENATYLLQQVQALTDAHDAPDQARAKLYKAIGYTLTGKAWGKDPTKADLDALPDPIAETARDYFARALELFDGVGVKKDLERLLRRLKDTD